jgi:hypothetical protein
VRQQEAERDEPRRPQREHPPERRAAVHEHRREHGPADPDDRLRAQEQARQV